MILRVWCSLFPSSVDLESLGPLFGQIVVTLSPFADHHSATVSKIFDFLIIQNKWVLDIRGTSPKIALDKMPCMCFSICCFNFFREVLGSFFDEIYFMPDVLSLACINTELRKHSYTSKRYLVPGQKCSCEWDVIGRSRKWGHGLLFTLVCSIENFSVHTYVCTYVCVHMFMHACGPHATYCLDPWFNTTFQFTYDISMIQFNF